MADPTPDSEPTAPTAMSTSVQTLVRQLTDSATHSGCDGDGDWGDVLLDVEVDGVRCVLVRSPDRPDQASVPLTPRELEIARMVAMGYPNKTIARALKISTWTVASHLRRVFSKLGVSSRAAMVARLLEDAQLGEHDLEHARGR